MTDEHSPWCFAWIEPDRSLGPGEQTLAAMLRTAKWLPGEAISISFLDGPADLQQSVIAAAGVWVSGLLANLRFRWVRHDPAAPSDIRISFQYAGSWSVIGNTCRQLTDPLQPTMNLGTIDPSRPENLARWQAAGQAAAQAAFDTELMFRRELRRTVLHEFGHALGLVHEHQHPAGGIQWNRAQVLRDLSGPPNNWPLEMIEQNVFKPFEEGLTNHTSHVDVASIMTYPIPRHWTLDGFSAPLNDDLSTLDRQFIRDQYP